MTEHVLRTGRERNPHKPGRLVAAVLGPVLMIVGIVLTVTLIAAPVGIPLIIF